MTPTLTTFGQLPTEAANLKSQISLDSDWKFQMAYLAPISDTTVMGYKIKDQWYPITIPNTVLGGLYENGLIENPYYRNNEKKLQWLEEKDWIFEKNFDTDDAFLKNDHTEIVFHSLDTYAEVSLNGIVIIRADNQFRTWKADIKTVLRPSNNILRIYFYSPISKEEYKKVNAGIDLPETTTPPSGARMYSRKAAFHYGWDWGPRLLTCGIGPSSVSSVAIQEDLAKSQISTLKSFVTPAGGLNPSVELIGWNNARILDLHLQQTSLTDQLGKISAEYTIESHQESTATIKIEIDGKTFEKKTALSTGLNTIQLNAEVTNPQKWWTHALGAPNLYTAKATVLIEGKEIDAIERRMGFRTLELIRDKDIAGETFYFKLNGHPIFAKGANMIPEDFFQERVTKEKTTKLINDAIAVNMNMIRVWGGGIYQPDLFYNLCDEKGILVWQDFMFACAMYPGDRPFLENVHEEAKEQVTRLRNHPCIAIWCGNNEIKEAWNNWGWKGRFSKSQQEKIWNDYESLFNDILPKAVADYAPNMPYHESSPNYSRYNPKNFTEGDCHYWGVWHDEQPFSAYEQKIPRFMSEYGFQSFPDWKELQSFAPPEELSLESESMLAHQKHPKGNKLIKSYMQKYYKTPKNFKDFTYVSQLLQADGISTAIEAHRRAMPYCMGSLYWQLNDIWPAVSWSGIDAKGDWKALHYRLKDAFSTITISPIVERDTLKVYVISDKLEQISGDLQIQLMDFGGKLVYTDGRYIDVRPNTSHIYFEAPLEKIAQGASPNSIFFYLTFKDKYVDGRGNGVDIRKPFFLTPPKSMNLFRGDIAKQIFKTDGGFLINFDSKVLAKSVYLSSVVEGFFDENFFDIIPYQTKRVLFKTKASEEEVEKSLSIMSLIDTF